jgi:BioD-like phosphotransacetylase family protein
MSEAQTQPSEAAMRAATALWIEDDPGWMREEMLLRASQIIDRETGLPQLIAERDRLAKMVEIAIRLAEFVEHMRGMIDKTALLLLRDRALVITTELNAALAAVKPEGK